MYRTIHTHRGQLIANDSVLVHDTRADAEAYKVQSKQRCNDLYQTISVECRIRVASEDEWALMISGQVVW